MGVVQGLGRASARAESILIRRNTAQRLAGLGYAAITVLWLVLLTRQPGSVSVASAAILSAFTVLGIGMSLYRDDLIIEPVPAQVVHLKGLPGVGHADRYEFSDLDRIEIQEGGSLRPGADTSGPFTRRWCSVMLVPKSGRCPLRLWSMEGEDSDLDALRQKALKKATPYAQALGLKVVPSA